MLCIGTCICKFLSDIQSLKEEAKILWGLHKRCQYILQLYGIMNTIEGIGLVMEYMQHGNVSDFFRKIGKRDNLGDKQIVKRRIAWQVSVEVFFLAAEIRRRNPMRIRYMLRKYLQCTISNKLRDFEFSFYCIRAMCQLRVAYFLLQRFWIDGTVTTVWPPQTFLLSHQCDDTSSSTEPFEGGDGRLKILECKIISFIISSLQQRFTFNFINCILI